MDFTTETQRPQRYDLFSFAGETAANEKMLPSRENQAKR
jgi:hypothetical protein